MSSKQLIAVSGGASRMSVRDAVLRERVWTPVAIQYVASGSVDILNAGNRPMWQ